MSSDSLLLIPIPLKNWRQSVSKGVRVAFQIAAELNAELAILVARKLPFPDNPEAGFGVIAEDGSIFIHPYAARGISKEVPPGQATESAYLPRLHLFFAAQKAGQHRTLVSRDRCKSHFNRHFQYTRGTFA